MSGSSAIEQRPGFLKLLDRLERDDLLVVTKLDRLGHNSIDVPHNRQQAGGAGGPRSLPGAGWRRSGAVAREMKASRATKIARVSRASRDPSLAALLGAGQAPGSQFGHCRGLRASVPLHR